ncbi:YHS domain-containing (seleno)protein [uncultured Methylophaga sp.]|uniref:YHS domain-containing (seleno)protein n=1 Tax=uncultured Methylophaga sp. TaxID=285271 RepID=UPI00262CC8E6|nr:YHS domain-containing (seleno)protein [uncultured Methylophaga sp.]|tara:strand:+ start:873 stop:1349 length:477 start_codon:yes stop_codon:yes gene_type:complete
MLKKIITTTAATLALSLSAASFAADIDMNANGNDLAIQGYDPVAYFTNEKPTKGSSDFTATYKNAIYHFSNEQNRDLFRASPAKYTPQFGGFCAFGVTKGRKFDTDPTAWRVVDGKLYLNLNKDVQKVWLADVPGYITNANQTWPTIKSFTDSALETF